MKDKMKKTKRSLMVFIILLSFMTAARSQERCIKVDLQAVSIDPLPPMIGKGQTATIIVAMKNNGPCIIPQGEGTAQITLIADYLELGTPLNFIDICGQWSYLGVISKDGQHNLFFQSTGGPIPVGGQFCSFQFDVKGKGITPSNAPTGITLVSTMSATATTADLDGKNQSAGTELRVTAAGPPVALSDFGAITNDCSAILSWKTTAEKNVTSFDVEQSADGIQFKKVGAVPAKNNAAGSAYDYTYSQGEGMRYYRLKIIEKGGQFSHSKMIILDTKCGAKKGF
ncbi:MAG: hypothetical protein ABI688_09375 [Bacteroidota bacterium]